MSDGDEILSNHFLHSLPSERDETSRPHHSLMLPPSSFENSCVSRVEPIFLSQQWKIENFPSLMKLALPGNCLRSTVFRDSALPEACWQLCLYPGGKRVENANHVSLFLKMSSTSPTREVRIKVEYRFYFLNENNLPLFSNVNVGEFHAKPPKGGHSWGLRNIPRQKVLNCILADGSLFISCHIELIPDINHVRCCSTKEAVSATSVLVCREFVKRQISASEQGYMSDCVLECNGQIIPVHKFVLSIHSKVFQAMFSHENVQESKEQRVEIKDADVEAVKMMLRYMYCGNVDVSPDPEGVLILAERYQMDELKLLCEHKLISRVDKTNVPEMLDLADVYNCDHLKSVVIDTLRANRSFVLSSAAWQVLKSSNPKLVTDVMETIIVMGELESSPPLKKQRMFRKRCLMDVFNEGNEDTIII
ncbi:hypothetical protein AB6A40_000954 [Gnathostoma spinigerum]|uniref:Uncharacterized protein n=1 Tax=Gnathostoma spinigerum TaxID=75299 RepID=A0ABD6E441_9BILA